MSPDDFMRSYEAATAAHDLEATLELIAEDAVYLFSDETSHAGKAAIRAVLERNFALIEAEEYRIEGLRWLAQSEEVAVGVYTYHWKGRVRGESASGSGRGTCALRQIEGQWRVVHEHLSRGSIG